MENKKSINNMDYVLVGDYYIPDLKLPNEERPIGKYGRMYREYLKDHNPMRFNDLVLDGQLLVYLADFIFDGVRLSISGSAISYVGKKNRNRSWNVLVFLPMM